LFRDLNEIHKRYLQNIPGITSFLKNKKKHYNNLSYIYYKILPFYNYTLLTATVKLSESFLEAIL